MTLYITYTHIRLYNIISHILAIALFTRARRRRRRFLIVCTHRTRTHVCFCDIYFPESSATLRWVTVRICDGVVFFRRKTTLSGFKLISERYSSDSPSFLAAHSHTTDFPSFGRGRTAALVQ